MVRMGLDKEQLYNLEHNYNLALNRLENSGVSEQNKKHIRKFLQYSALQHVDKLRRIFYIDKLKLIGTVISKDFKKWGEDEVLSFMGYLENKKKEDGTKQYKDSTIDSYIVTLKCFFRRINKLDSQDPVPKFLRILKRKRVKRRQDENDVVDSDDITKMINVSNNKRDKCMCSMNYETGLRGGELRSITISDLIKHPHGYKVYIGKNGAKTEDSRRSLLFVSSERYITEWLNEHPFKHNHDSPLFCNRSNGKVLTAQAVNRTIKKACLRAIGKDITQYTLRHSCVTRLTKKNINEKKIRKLMGHSENSNVLSAYQHLKESDIEEVILDLAGVEVEENNVEKEKFVPHICPSCKYKGSPTDVICPRCKSVIDPDGVILQETKPDSVIRKELFQEAEQHFRDLVQEELDKKWAREEAKTVSS